MKQRGVSPRQLQLLMDFPYVQTVYNWLAGKNVPSIDNLVVLSQVLDVSMDSLIVTRNVEIELAPPAARELTSCVLKEAISAAS